MIISLAGIFKLDLHEVGVHGIIGDIGIVISHIQLSVVIRVPTFGTQASSAC
jgi:hypothetical protein